MNDILLRALIAASVFLALLGIACLTRPHRERPRNARRECGNTIERRPNVRRPRDAEIRALVTAHPMSSTPTVIVPAWDDVTVTSPRGEV